MKYILYYLLAINFIGLVIMFIDKQAAKRKYRRVPERTLFTIAIIGGSIGVYSAMHLFHHKTLHKSFTIGIPLIFILQIALVIFIYNRFH